jgi:DNA-binding response OmpR family regulator
MSTAQVAPRILYVEDDENLAAITLFNLNKAGYEVTHCDNGNLAWDRFQQGGFQVCILDVMLPGMSGFSLASHIRSHNAEVPILFLTVKSQLEDKINGLQLGADDYLTKPFSFLELDLKIKVFLKRTHTAPSTASQVAIGSFCFDFDNLLLKSEAEQHQLTLKEAELLRFLWQKKNNVVKREEILRSLWGNDDYFLGRSLDVFISRLRKYFSVSDLVRIENVHGVGFKLTEKS